ncbi:hypothetical protein PVAND_013832 [Polypedilum vanderplanki]|uniref:Uncharacterized protein n=1 Tax=Polypedilum vanderplanki TaxID=319348 RepID=A0A9J6CRX4_POLVA|nr:hypothetical protein PVAND_013832 [Polypedilum vanderplanki]
MDSKRVIFYTLILVLLFDSFVITTPLPSPQFPFTVPLSKRNKINSDTKKSSLIKRKVEVKSEDISDKDSKNLILLHIGYIFG